MSSGTPSGSPSSSTRNQTILGVTASPSAGVSTSSSSSSSPAPAQHGGNFHHFAPNGTSLTTLSPHLHAQVGGGNGDHAGNATAAGGVATTEHDHGAAWTPPDVSYRYFLGHPTFLHLGALVLAILVLLLGRKFPKVFCVAGAITTSVWLGLMMQDMQDHDEVAEDSWWLPIFTTLFTGTVFLLMFLRQPRASVGVLTGLLAIVQVMALLRLWQVNVEQEFLDIGVWLYVVIGLFVGITCGSAHCAPGPLLQYGTVSLATLLGISALSYFIQRLANHDAKEKLRGRRGYSLLEELARISARVRLGQCETHFDNSKILEREKSADGLLWEKEGCKCTAGCDAEIVFWFLSIILTVYIQAKYFANMDGLGGRTNRDPLIDEDDEAPLEQRESSRSTSQGDKDRRGGNNIKSSYSSYRNRERHQPLQEETEMPQVVLGRAAAV
ncbi:unnamed protein product [Amoebophrya sp. A25]|nr:unnamed protein product [Amoebophrya sp. A25]|eukprot:GSA25T00013832001.1